MAKKKRGKKVSKRKINSNTKKVRVTKKKLNLVLKNLILFIIMAIVSFVLYYFLGKGFFKTLFFLLSMISGFVAIAFLIVLLVLIILKTLKK